MLAVLPLALMVGKAAAAAVSVPFDPVLVGQSGVVQPITFPASSTDITFSFPGDFTLSDKACGPNGCTVSVTFSPQYPGLRQNAVIARNGQAVIGTVFVHGIGLAPQASVHPGTIATVAGNGSMNYGTDGEKPTEAGLWNPLGLAVDPAGTLYIVDGLHQAVRKVSDQKITTVYTASSSPTAAPTGL